MKIFALIWLVIATSVGVIFWYNSQKSSLNTNTITTSNRGNQNYTEQADWDNAAEEVRAVASRIKTLELSIENLHQLTETRIQRMESEIENLGISIQTELNKTGQKDFVLALADEMDGLKLRITNLELEQPQISIQEIPQVRPKTSMTWYAGEEHLDINAVNQLSDLVYQPTSSSRILDSIESMSHDNVETSLVLPHYTIPPTTTLMNATALTALVGRIPVRGRLHDPWRFKIITGPENLAANGHRISQISGMLLSGTARGDLALSCVSGNIDTATFIFKDGSIQTVRKNANNESQTSGLGWISDSYGNPCIPGELKTNALSYLTQSTLINTTQATADAIANAQTDSKLNLSTQETSQSIVGDVDQFVLGHATSEALSEVSNWLNDRQLSSFDAIFVPAGQKVAVHIEESIQINYDPTGRKIDQLANRADVNDYGKGGFD